MKIEDTMRIKRFLSIVTIFIIAIATECAFAQEELKVEVKENKVSCTGVGPMQCLQVMFEDSDDWVMFYSEIEGFQYEEGFRYTLLVKRSILEDVSADASSYRYELIKILKQKKRRIPTTKESLPSPIEFLSKHKWKLIQFKGTIEDNSNVFIQFDEVRNRVSGNSGCNGFFGSVFIEDEHIRFNQLAGTLMACVPSQNSREQEILAILRNDELRFDIGEQTFNLYLGNELVMMFGLASL